jgi:hypothetical protein
LRDALTDTLQFYVWISKPFAEVEYRLFQALAASGEAQVVDLCSGAGGPWRELAPRLQKVFDRSVPVVLTDLYPNQAAFGHAAEESSSRILPENRPVDARYVPEDLQGFRTLFSSFHHFKPDDARQILRDAARHGNGIAVFEAQERRLSNLLFFLLYFPLTFLAAPLVRPFRWPRLFWTYVVPALPIIITHDALVSCVRTYTPEELRDLSSDLEEYGVHGEIGRSRIPHLPLQVTYLVARYRSVGVERSARSV